jgi:hypothetical protein
LGFLPVRLPLAGSVFPVHQNSCHNVW